MHNGTAGRPHSFVPGPSGVELYGWTSTPVGSSPGLRAYVAVFNAAPAAHTVTVPVAAVGFSGAAALCVRDLWTHRGAAVGVVAGGVSVAVNGHGAAALLVTLLGDAACKTGV